MLLLMNGMERTRQSSEDGSIISIKFSAKSIIACHSSSLSHRLCSFDWLLFPESAHNFKLSRGNLSSLNGSDRQLRLCVMMHLHSSLQQRSTQFRNHHITMKNLQHSTPTRSYPFSPIFPGLLLCFSLLIYVGQAPQTGSSFALRLL